MMLESCFVLIHCDKEMRNAVLAQLSKIHGIDEIKKLDNDQEILVKVVASSKDHIRGIITWKIQKMTCVQRVQNLGSNISK